MNKLMATAAGQNRCVKCGKDKSTLRCGGCLQEFSYKHLADHRDARCEITEHRVTPTVTLSAHR
jgi:hypothetical protein